MANKNSTNAKKYILKMQNYPKTEQFDKDIIFLMALDKFGYKKIEEEKEKFFKKYKAYYESGSCKQRVINYNKFEKEGVVIASGKRTYETSAPGKLDKMIQIYDNSSMSDEQKITAMHELFITPEDFFDRFKDLYPLFMHTQRMQKFVDVCNFMKEEKNKFTYEKLNYVDSIKSRLESYPEALRVMKKFIDSNCYTYTLFLKIENITRAQFDSYVETLKLLSPSLYMNVIDRKNENSAKSLQKQRERYAANSVVINTLVNRIIECNKNNEQFDILEFYKLVPFKSSEYFIKELLDFANKHMPKSGTILYNYIHANNLSTRSRITPVNYFNINNPKNITIINGITFDTELDLKLIDYLKKNSYPVYNNTLRIARRKYANGEITLEENKELTLEKN